MFLLKRFIEWSVFVLACFADGLKAVNAAVEKGRMALLVGNCRVFYEGRAASKLSEGDRLVVVKGDGTFLVHQSTKMAAINYQGPGAVVRAGIAEDGMLEVSAQRRLASGVQERISVKFNELFFAQDFALKDDAKLKVFGSERELSGLLMQDLSVIEEGLKPLQRESVARKGTIDILAEDFRGRLVVIEVKRRSAGLDAVTQLARYVEEIGKRKDKQVRGILVSPEITANAFKMLEREGLEYFKLDYEVGNPCARIKGLQKKQRVLSEY
ncbi:MAG: endonuclease NucS [Candidatus Micrarchaeia archaeon]|jgi:RecB family endonuclease NucS